MKKIIGVMLSSINCELAREFIVELHRAASEKDCKILIFNSICSYRIENNQGSKALFHMIPYEKLSAMIILHELLYDKELIAEVIAEADKHGVPVIYARKKDDRTYSFIGDYETAYEQLIRHVIFEHGARNLFFLSGLSSGDTDSIERYKIFKRVVAECGVEFDDSMMDYGEYWEKPAVLAIERLYESGREIPDAIFCANDIMAMGVSEWLSEYGYDVPGRVIVVGFDGIESAKCAVPRIATVEEDMGEMCRMIIDSVEKIHNNESVSREQHYNFRPVFSESCGCVPNDVDSLMPKAMLKTIRTNREDELAVNQWLDTIILHNNIETFRTRVSVLLGKNEYLCLRKDNISAENDDFLEKYTELGTDFEIKMNLSKIIPEKFDFENDFVPGGNKWLLDDSICVATTVYVKNVPLGIHFGFIKNVLIDTAKIERHVSTFNQALMICILGERQAVIKSKASDSKYTDSITGVLNLRGLMKWFDEYGKMPANHDKLLAVSEFTLINAENILNQFGPDAEDKAYEFIASLLIKSHPADTIVAKTGRDSFTLAIFASDAEDRRNRLLSSAEKFYDGVMEYNKDHNQIEVSSGSVDLNPGWNCTLSQYINSATNEIYVNRMKLYEGISESKRGSGLDDMIDKLKLFDVLVTKQMVHHFFQPIIDAYSGEIVGYEALMRSNGDINMPPLEILDIARRHRRLYDVEKLTFFLVLERIRKDRELFGGRKVFINSIPGEFLNEEDCEIIRSTYGEELSDLVIEITEDAPVSAEELERIKKLGVEGNIPIAVDDYGTGHSNIVNLLTYGPQIVKVDRFLICDIQKDRNKQMFVRNVVEFAQNAGIRVLAEGVETEAEMKTVVELGIDLIQGYYTARPSFEIIRDLPPAVKEQIQDAGK